MKKLLYTLLAVSIIFTACEKEEEVYPYDGVWDVAFKNIINRSGVVFEYDATANMTSTLEISGVFIGGAFTLDNRAYVLNGMISINEGNGTEGRFDAYIEEGVEQGVDYDSSFSFRLTGELNYNSGLGYMQFKRDTLEYSADWEAVKQ